MPERPVEFMLTRSSEGELRDAMRARARAIHDAGSLASACKWTALPKLIETTLSEALVLGLLKQGVRKYLAIFGHGSTDLGDVLRIYEEEGVTRTFNCRNEVEMAHAATALRWQYGETPAVVTSIGPGALQAFAGSLAAASNGVGVYHIYGDETTFGEGYNMQQVPKEEQGLFGRMTATAGRLLCAAYAGSAARCAAPRRARGESSVSGRVRSICCCRSTRSRQRLTVNLAALPDKPDLPTLAPVDDRGIRASREADRDARKRIAIKAGGGTRGHDAAVRKLAEAAGAAVVLSPGSTGVLPDAHPQNMHVGGSNT